MQQRPSYKRRKGKEVPFGIRAIESGVEVDGVWISKTNTPSSSMPASPEILPAAGADNADIEHSAGFPPTTSNAPRPDFPQPTHPYLTPTSARSSASSKRSNLPFERANFVEKPSSRPVSTMSENTSLGRPTYQPRRSSGLRYSTSDQSAALATLEGRRPPGRTQWSNAKQDNQTPQRGQPYHDESEWTPVKAYYHPSDITSGPSPRALAPIVTSASDPFVTPVESPVEERRIRNSHEPRVSYGVPGSGGLMQGQASPTHTTDPFENQQVSFDNGRLTRETQVVRKVNSGFEILRPGTLDRPRQSSDGSHRTWAAEAGHKRDSKRLHRKRGSSAISQSHFVEQL